MIRSARIDALAVLQHGLTTREAGSVGPGSSPLAEDVRRRAAAALGADAARLVTGHQTHGSHVAVVGRREGGTAALGATDGLATRDAGTLLMVQGADCPLLLLVDPNVRALGLVHSGWRGTVGGIGARAVEALVSLGARRERLIAALFPGIGPCCFEVGPEVVAAFTQSHGPAAAAWSRAAPRGGDRVLFDLHAAIQATLVGAGVPPESVDVVAGCTVCDGRLFSHRASRGGPGRHGLFAALS